MKSIALFMWSEFEISAGPKSSPAALTFIDSWWLVSRNQPVFVFLFYHKEKEKDQDYLY